MHNNVLSPEALECIVIEKPAQGKTSQEVPDVTVVTACLNALKAGRRELLLKNINSVQRQTGVTIEHIIVDGASTDGTLDILKHYRNTRHDIRILSKPDSGIYQAMNRGLALARGKYVIFLNTDDCYHNDEGLMLSVKALEESDCSFSFSPLLARKKKGTSVRKPQNRLHKFFVFCVTPHPSMMFRTADLVAVGGYDEDYHIAADYDAMLRLIVSGRKACFVDCCFATFVEGGFAMQNKEMNRREKSKIIRNVYREAFGVELSEGEADYVVRRCVYPRKHLSVYVASQELVRRSFVGLPQGLFDKLLRRFNYIKYYLKCRLP